MKGVCHKPFAMVMEWMNYGSLYDFLHAEDGIPLDWQIAIGLAKDIGYILLSSKQTIIRRI